MSDTHPRKAVVLSGGMSSPVVSRILRRLLIFVLLILGGWLAWRHWPATPGKNGSAKASAEKRPVSVTVVAVSTSDVPIWLSGLGAAQAYNKVTVRPQVSGALKEIDFTEGQQVKAGDILARIDPRPYQSRLAQAEAKVAQTAAQLQNAHQDQERIGKLVKTGAESRQLFDQIEANVAQFAAQQQADNAAVEAARLDLDFTTVRAPIAGRTGLRMVDEGNLLTANQEQGLVVITQVQPISVVFTLSQDHLPALRKAMSATAPVTIQALGDGDQVLAEGKLELLDNEIDPASGTVKLKAAFPNADLALWPGQFLTARALVETRSQAIVVPAQVITAGLDGPFVYLVKSNKTVEVRKVTPGPQVDDVTIIEDGLQAGEKVVLDGQSKLQPGAAITIQPSMP